MSPMRVSSNVLRQCSARVATALSLSVCEAPLSAVSRCCCWSWKASLVGLLWQLRHLHADVHGTPAWKHSQ